MFHLQHHLSGHSADHQLYRLRIHSRDDAVQYLQSGSPLLRSKLASLFLMVPFPLYRSFTSFFLQVLIVKGLTPIIAAFLQHATQSGLFFYSTYIILVNDWCSTHTAFIIIQACAHFMKMHSYVTVNR
jgi:hypothetical protein